MFVALKSVEKCPIVYISCLYAIRDFVPISTLILLIFDSATTDFIRSDA